uniref:Uncharacterized protein n=1 Tax=Glossina pallidipes TaxID=7398 RepID=A0A1B0AFT5_GLOPL
MHWNDANLNSLKQDMHRLKEQLTTKYFPLGRNFQGTWAMRRIVLAANVISPTKGTHLHNATCGRTSKNRQRTSELLRRKDDLFMDFSPAVDCETEIRTETWAKVHTVRSSHFQRRPVLSGSLYLGWVHIHTVTLKELAKPIFILMGGLGYESCIWNSSVFLSDGLSDVVCLELSLNMNIAALARKSWVIYCVHQNFNQFGLRPCAIGSHDDTLI